MTSSNGKPHDPLLLSDEDLRQCGLTDFEFVEAQLLEMFRCHARGDFTQPPSLHLKRDDCPHVADRIFGLGAHLGGAFGVEGIKWIASAHGNHQLGLPRANGVIVLNDDETRLPLCVMEGTLVSAMRTAIVQVIACRYLAREDASSLGLVGCGRIGGLTLMALCAAFPGLKDVRAYDLDPERAARFQAHMAGLGVNLSVADSPAGAVADADVSIASTTASEPYLGADCFKAGSVFLNVSLMDPTYDMVLAADKIVVDDRVQSLASNRVLARVVREGLMSADDIHAELGQIVCGEKSGRESPEERIFFNPFGMAIEDLALAHSLYKRASTEGIGHRVKLCGSEWGALF